MQSNNNTKTITIFREHDKLCILEKLLNNDPKLEKLASDFIDYSIQKDNQYRLQCFKSIQDIVKDTTTLETIIQICTSIAYDTRVELPISIVNNNNDVIKYINQPFIPLFT